MSDWSLRSRPGLSLALCAALILAASAARAQSNGYNSLTASWTAPGDDGNTGQVSAYELFYDTRAPGADVAAWWNAVPYSQRVSLIPPLAAAGQPDSARVTGLSQGTTYYFVIVARDEAANVSGYSNVATGSTLSCGAPTSTPSSFAAEVDSLGVQVNWDAAADPAALSLHLYRAVGSAPAWTQIQSLPPSSTSFRDTQTSPGTTYRYRAAWAGPDIQGVSCEGPATAQAVVTTPARAGAAAISGSGQIHAYPNPATDHLQVALDVTAPSPIAAKIRVYDLNGHWLATIAEGTFPPGRSVVTWDRLGRTGLKLAPGYYELLGTVGNSRVRERIVLLP
jgi:hypothetical protein